MGILLLAAKCILNNRALHFHHWEYQPQRPCWGNLARRPRTWVNISWTNMRQFSRDFHKHGQVLLQTVAAQSHYSLDLIQIWFWTHSPVSYRGQTLTVEPPTVISWLYLIKLSFSVLLKVPIHDEIRRSHQNVNQHTCFLPRAVLPQKGKLN